MRISTRIIAGLSGMALAGAALTTAAQAQITPGLLTQLAEACLQEGTATPVGEAQLSSCCAVVTALGPENADFLEAIANTDRNDPRLIVLNQALVDMLVLCQPEAAARLAEIG